MEQRARSLPRGARQAILVVAVASLLVTACGDGDGTATGDAGTTNVDSGGTTPPDGGAALSCPEIFDCVAACPDSACEDACIERGTPEGLALATAVAVCADENACTTEECLSAACADELLACADATPTPDGGTPVADGGTPDGGGPTCSPGVGIPQLTGALTGLSASYAAGATITVDLPVDADTRRAAVSIYQVGSSLTLGSAATEVSTGTATLSLAAGTAAAPAGTYYLQVDLCSTSLCASPLARNVYDREGADTEYTETRTRTSMPTEVCATTIPIATFTIE